jgi:hypothetical protein
MNEFEKEAPVDDTVARWQPTHLITSVPGVSGADLPSDPALHVADSEARTAPRVLTVQSAGPHPRSARRRPLVIALTSVAALAVAGGAFAMRGSPSSGGEALAPSDVPVTSSAPSSAGDPSPTDAGEPTTTATTAVPTTAETPATTDAATTAPVLVTSVATPAPKPTTPRTTASPTTTQPPITAPSAPTISSWAESGSGAVKLTVQGPSNWGNASNGVRKLEYNLNGNVASGWAAFPGTGVISGLTNCRAYNVAVRATNESYSSLNNPVSTVKSYGAPSNPTASASVSGQNITWNWATAGSKNGDCTLTVSVKVDGSAISTAAAGPTTKSYGYSTSHTLTVTVTDAKGATASGLASASIGAAPPPPPPQWISISWGGFNTYPSGSCSVGECRWVNISTGGWAAGQQLIITCDGSYGRIGPYTKNANGSGGYSTSGLCMYGPGVTSVHVVISGVGSNYMNW